MLLLFFRNVIQQRPLQVEDFLLKGVVFDLLFAVESEHFLVVSEHRVVQFDTEFLLKLVHGDQSRL